MENTKATQKMLIMKALKKGAVLTTFKAFIQFKCTKLSTRIGELKKDGFPVDIKMVKGKNGSHYAEYRMAR